MLTEEKKNESTEEPEFADDIDDNDLNEEIDAEKVKINIDSENTPVQNGGTQNNYFNFVEESEYKQSIRENKISTSELIKLSSVYVPHDYDSVSFKMIKDRGFILINGNKNIGKFTFCLNFLREKGFKNILSINEISNQNISDIKWRSDTGYIVKKVVDADVLSELYESIGKRIEIMNSFLCVIQDVDELVNSKLLFQSVTLDIYYITLSLSLHSSV